MQTRHRPWIDRRYWSGIIFASIFGTNLGDLYAHDSRLGLGLGLLVLVVLFSVDYWVETKDRAPREIYYWLAIIVIRTGATNIADYLAYRVGIAGPLLVSGLAAIIAMLAWLGRAGRTSSVADPATPVLAETALAYWAAMLAAGVFGTVAGDLCSHLFGQGPSSLALGSAFVMLLAAAGERAATHVAVYWCVVAVARTSGTCIGDWLAENRMLHLGLPLSTLLTGLAFVAILVLWRGTPRDARAFA